MGTVQQSVIPITDCFRSLGYRKNRLKISGFDCNTM